ncbi:DUF177 domain-containing protein [Thermodesulfobacteriota bacterium]
MKIRTDNIPEEGLFLELEESPESFPVLGEIRAAGEAEFISPIKMKLSVRLVSAIVEIEGTLQTSLRIPCSRCLNGFEIPLQHSFALTYTQDVSEAKPVAGAEIEITEYETGLIPYRGKEISLREGIQEQLVLALPLRPLCTASCKGLCPRCGANLNEGECGCDRSAVDSRFAVLKNFKTKDK